MDAQQMLGVLLDTTEQQSQTSEKLLEALQSQIDALNTATLAAQRAAAIVSKSAATVELAARNVVPVIHKATGEAVGGAVRDSLAEVSQTASGALETAVKPILGKLSGLVRTASEAESNLNAATDSFGWKWVAVASVIGAGVIVTISVVAWGAIWYQRSQIESLAGQKTQLEAQVADLEKRGGRIKLEKCGDQSRLCVRVDKSRGYGKDGDYFVIRGY